MTTHYDLIVVGEGIAGLSCANAAASLGLKVATFEAEFFGGLITNINELDRFEEADGLSGMDYAAQLARANRQAGVSSRTASVSGIRATEDGFTVDTEAGTFSARAVAIASGASVCKLNVPGEEAFEGRGVSHCADCDAPMFTGTEVVVIGSGDWALHEALVLAPECTTVHVVHQGSAPGASSDYLARASAAGNIHLHSDTTIEAVLGEAMVTAVRLRSADGSQHELPCAGVFPFAGLQPNTAVAPREAERDAEGHLLVDTELRTSMPGLWAIGQARAGFGGWLSDAIADGRRAAQAIQAYTA